MAGKSFTGIRRSRKTRTSVRVADLFSRIFITAAGMGTILAVSLVCVFLVVVVIPLFQGGDVTASQTLPAPKVESGAEPIHVEIDEYQSMGYAFYPDTTVAVFRLDSGQVIDTIQVIPGEKPTCWSFGLQGGNVAFGFADGRIQFGTITFNTTYLDLKDMAPERRAMKPGELATLDKGVVEVTPLGQFRLQQLAVDLKDPIDLKSNSPVKLIDLSMLNSGPVFATMTADGVFRINSVREIRNVMTRKVTYVPTGGQVEIPLVKTKGMAKDMVLEGRGDSAVIAWEDGTAIRVDGRDKATPIIAEELTLVDDGAKITLLDTLIGKMTLVVGDSKGHVATWFRVKADAVATTKEGLPVVRASDLHPPVAQRLRAAQASELKGEMANAPSDWMVCETPDASVLVRQHILPTSREGKAVTALGASKRNRMIAVGFADGHFDLIHVTSQQLLAQNQISTDGKPIASIGMSPKNDGLIAATGTSLALWDIKIPHPETTFGSIFTPVWYEGSLKPEQVWQSSAADDAFEPKYGLYPLVFGTLKATFYSMLFGVPIALLAAIHTSEFLHPRTKARIKPTVEVMASLPSVVLGFLAALVFAPFVEDIVTAVLLGFFVGPATVLLSAFLWQLIPSRLSILMGRYRFLLIVVTVPVGLLLTLGIAGVAETMLFGGDVRGWLAWKPSLMNPDQASPYRSATGGWLLLILPFSALIVTMFTMGIINPIIRVRTLSMERSKLGIVHLVKFVIGAFLAVLLAAALGGLLNTLGFDPRGSIVDTYIQRNALIVGFVMGFAVIPIIYTLSEDALSAVPDHLRAASLGAGATKWQTAIRIIIPTAMSGIFSACMIGLGRAVGETMIVLMAAGNTPIMDMNMFSGFRTLSANIAVELPESVQHGTHYRMLFLAALSLFVMTFILNTVAEVVRLRFRKRAFQL